VIQLERHEFDVEGIGSRCAGDYLEVYDGEYKAGPLIGRYCGNEAYETALPPTIKGTTDMMNIVFVSDETYNEDGFYILATAHHVYSGNTMYD